VEGLGFRVKGCLRMALVSPSNCRRNLFFEFVVGFSCQKILLLLLKNII
jgi:hypothetical protein